MKPTPARHAREESGCSSTTSESSFVEGLFNVWSHVVHEDDDDVKESLAMLGGMPERGGKGRSEESRTVDASVIVPTQHGPTVSVRPMR